MTHDKKEQSKNDLSLEKKARAKKVKGVSQDKVFDETFSEKVSKKREQKIIVYSGNSVFDVNDGFGLYGNEDIDPLGTHDAMLEGFVGEYQDVLKQELGVLGLEFVGLVKYSPQYYNFEDDSIDLELKVVDGSKWVRAVKLLRTEIDAVLAENKSCDGYMATSVRSVAEEELSFAEKGVNFEPDCVILGFMLSRRIPSLHNFCKHDYFIYDVEEEETNKEDGKNE